MKVAAYYGPGDVRIEDRPVPTPGPNQLVVKIDYVGVCGTDVEFFKGGCPPFVKLPMVLGHENVGTVTAVGEGVTDYQVGDRILCGPPSHCAEDCPSCKRGETNICIYGFPRTAGIGGPDGGYAEYMLVRDVKHTMLVKIPEGVDPKDAVLFDVICVSLHGIRKSNFKLGDNVVVSGTGAIGLAAIQFLKAGGANKIIALGTSPSKYPLLKEYGADYCLNPKELGDHLGEEICKLLGSPVGADVVYECAGNQNSLMNCVFQCVKPGGQVMVIGTIQEPLTNIVPGQFSIHEPDLNFSFVYTPEEVQMYLEMLAAGKIKFPGMVTDIIALDDCVEKALDRKDRSGMIKILIDPTLS
ncbi:MAG: alcohol dehydrogenase catalytic domain-containing protein [Oscillospiraceae bacterium]|nr:alcohol dehydrogenase catalytic domain-containing protein [Oscillospiraceae bacterium]